MCKERAASDSYVCGFFGYATVIYLLYVVQRIINDDSLSSVFILNECNQTNLSVFTKSNYKLTN